MLGTAASTPLTVAHLFAHLPPKMAKLMEQLFSNRPLGKFEIVGILLKTLDQKFALLPVLNVHFAKTTCPRVPPTPTPYNAAHSRVGAANALTFTLILYTSVITFYHNVQFRTRTTMSVFWHKR